MPFSLLLDDVHPKIPESGTNWFRHRLPFPVLMDSDSSYLTQKGMWLCALTPLEKVFYSPGRQP